MNSTVVIARDFSRSPAGRNYSDGPFSGERFRKEFLVPMLGIHDRIEVDMRGALGFGSSFLEEAFGGLVREHHLEPSQLRRRLNFTADVSTYIDRIWKHVEKAGQHHFA